MRQKPSLYAFAAFLLCSAAGSGIMPAFAQTPSTLVDVAVPDSFDRGRNKSVMEHDRSDYQQLPIPAGPFNLYPSLETGVGASNNVYQTNADKVGDGYAFIKPSLSVQSDWAVHSLELNGRGNFKRYFNESPRNLSLFNLRALGRLDMDDVWKLYGDARYDREFESAQTGAIDLQGRGRFSTYNRLFLGARAERQAGQSRVTLAYDHSVLDFSPIDATPTATIAQATRDRNIDRVTGQVEYAFTPSAAIYGQASYERTDYSTPIVAFGGNRDADAGRFLAGLSLDFAGLLRGKIGLGYAFRDYRLPVFDDVKGFSADVKLEYFPTELTTFTLGASRTIEDTAIGSTSAFYDTRANIQVDHELLRNLILHSIVEYGWQNYIGDPLRARNVRVNFGAEYFSSRKVKVVGNLNLYHRRDNGTGQGSNFYEYSSELSIIYQF